MRNKIDAVLVFCCVSLIASIICDDEVRVDYFEKLIEENIKLSNSYKLPEKNAEFESGNKHTKSKFYGEFDFIIVGAGSAGCVVATRLSEIANWKILLLEAGGEQTDFSDIPAMQPYLFNSPMAWGYKTVPQKHACFDDDEKRCQIKRGKVLGGTSVINGVHYTRGNRHDFDSWAQMGLPQWSYFNVLPYFKKSENSQVDGDEFYHGKGGYLNVEYSLPDIETFPIFADANLELGRKYVDYNGVQQLGFSRFQFTTKHGRRQSTATAFLSNARERRNLNVTTNALVTRVVIDRVTKRAEGVYFIKDGQKFRALAKWEVILSGGTYNSAQLLMLSGIGPQQHLQELGIEVIKDLPVGQSLIEQPIISLTFNTNYTIKEIPLREQIKLYLNGTGPLTKTSKVSGIAFEHLPGIPRGVPMFEYLYGDDDKSLDLIILLQHPKSRGTVKLKSNNPIDFPLIDLNLLSDPADSLYFAQATNLMFKLAETRAFRSVNATFDDIPDACRNMDPKSQEYLHCFLAHKVSFICHPCSSARMGVFEENSVVGEDLKVHGFHNLRVVDASVIPVTTSGHLNAVVIMIAEKASDFIKREHLGSFVPLAHR